MGFFRREEQPPRFSSYRSYKPYLRRDFRRQCAYCERTEEYLPEPDVFGVDHFRPRSLFPELDCEYVNLYYCCNRCNRNKGDAWPSHEELEIGVAFIDPCESDPYVTHIAEGADALVRALTPIGAFSIDLLRLNDAPYVQFRSRRAQTAQFIEALRDRLRDTESSASAAELDVARRALDQLEAAWAELFRR